MASGTTDLDLENASTHCELFKLFLLGSLGQNLPTRWTAATTTPADRKRIVRLVIREVILDPTRAKEKV
ncbi:MAG: hypothetical protein U1F76_22810 [Candidatus Competibacteraceae bacterium]